MATLPREFICEDCKSVVFTYGGNDHAGRTRCYDCTFVRSMELDAAGEKELRELLCCQLSTEEGEKT